MVTVEVHLDKIMKELWKELTYKNALVLKMRLEGMTIEKINAHFGFSVRSTAAMHMIKIRRVLGVKSNIELAFLCYERGYVTITEIEDDRLRKSLHSPHD